MHDMSFAGFALVQKAVVRFHYGEQACVRCEGLRYSSRAAQQGCGDSERGISSGRTNVLTVI